MNELTVVQNNLPATMPELARFVLVGTEKLAAVKAEIRAIKKVGLAKEVYEQKKMEAQEIAEAVQLASVQMGKILNTMPKESGAETIGEAQARKDLQEGDRNRLHEFYPGEKFKKTVSVKKAKGKSIEDLGFNGRQAWEFQQMANNEETVKKAMQEARDNDDIVSRAFIMGKIKDARKRQKIQRAQADIAAQRRADTNAPILAVGNGIGFVPNEPYSLLLTDPPYSTDVDDIDAFANAWLPNALEHVRPDGFAYVFIGAYPREARAYLSIEPPSHMELVQMLVWTYRNTLGNNPADRYKLNYQFCLFYRGKDAPPLDCPIKNEQWAVQDINAPDGRIGDRFHAWQKPMEIAERFVRHSTRPGDAVFDPFACTGTFLLAAAGLGRRAYGFEVDERNAAIAYERGCSSG